MILFHLITQKFIANGDHLGFIIIISVKFLHCKAKGFKVCGCKNSTSVKVNFFKEGPHSLIFLHCITNSIFKQFKSAVNAKSFHINGGNISFSDFYIALDTPPLWTDLVKISSRKPRHASYFSLECTDFKNVIFEKIHWAHSEDTEVAEVKRPRNLK